MRTIFVLVILVASSAFAEVKFGTDVLRESNFAILKGKRVGLLANPASVDSHLNHTADNFRASKEFKLVALFGPEHGIYGDEYAGEKVADSADKKLGIPTFSVYGKTRRPTTQMLAGLDALVIDIQDIGSRSYTFVSSMRECMDACNEHGVELIMLDRPNPLGGERIEGPGMSKGFESFVGMLHVPYVHGMTIGELAELVRAEDFPRFDKLTIVKMASWRREMIWDETGHDWVQTSPNIPTAKSCAAYAATGIAGELESITIGAGYTLPFEIFGAPKIEGDTLARKMNQGTSLEKNGVQYRPVHFKPFYGKFADRVCQGVQVHLDPKRAENLVEINFRLLAAIGSPGLEPGGSRNSMFDKVCGSDEPRMVLAKHGDLAELFAKWRKQCDEFREYRKKFLLY